MGLKVCKGLGDVRGLQGGVLGVLDVGMAIVVI